MSLEAAVFDTEWKNVQAQTSTTKDGVTYQYLTNGGNARSSGAEATYMLFPVQDLTLRATGAYTNSHLTEDAPALGGLSGDAMPFTAKWTGSLAADYRFAIGGYPSWVGGSYNYIGKRISNFTNTALGKYPLNVPSYTTFDLNAGIEIAKVKLSDLRQEPGQLARHQLRQQHRARHLHRHVQRRHHPAAHGRRRPELLVLTQ